jgi:hypothetical protein
MLIGGHEKLSAERVADGQSVHGLPGSVDAFCVVGRE